MEGIQDLAHLVNFYCQARKGQHRAGFTKTTCLGA